MFGLSARWVFLALFLSFFIPFSSFAAPSSQELQTQISQTVSSFLKQRQGIIFLLDLQNSSQQIYGNRELIHQSFLPGSIMKLLVAEAGLEANPPHFECKGRLKLNGKRLNCWSSKGHGSLELPQALAFSCNLYFIHWAEELGALRLIQEFSKYFLVSEDLQKVLKENSLNLARFAIGDFPAFQVSPEHMMEFWKRYLKELEKPSYAPIRQGLLRATGEGTARKSHHQRLEILGKTGTADALSSHIKTHGWFLGAAPALHPQFAVVIFLKNAYGFDQAAQLGGAIFQIILEFGLLK